MVACDARGVIHMEGARESGGGFLRRGRGLKGDENNIVLYSELNQMFSSRISIQITSINKSNELSWVGPCSTATEVRWQRRDLYYQQSRRTDRFLSSRLVRSADQPLLDSPFWRTWQISWPAPAWQPFPTDLSLWQISWPVPACTLIGLSDMCLVDIKPTR